MGDGTTLTGPVISYCYKELKNYLVELDVTVNKTGEVRRAEKSFQVILLDQDVVDFQASATTVHVGETVAFEATRAMLPQCGKVALLWDFRDGRLANGPKATHSFRKPGTFAVRFSLRGEGPDTCTESHCVSRTITVLP
jgi:PKD repeat protein